MNADLLPRTVAFAFLLIIVASLAGTDSARGEDPIRWRALLIIKAHSDINHPEFGAFKATMDWENIARVTRAFERHLPDMIREVSGGEIELEGRAVVSSEPVTKIDKVNAADYWPNLDDLLADFRNPDTFLAAAGEYDSIFVYWMDRKGNEGLKRGAAVAFTDTTVPLRKALGCGYSTVLYGEDSRLWGAHGEGVEGFLHEWLHQLEFHYKRRYGAALPLAGGKDLKEGLHVAEAIGFVKQNGTDPKLGYWKSWYSTYLQGRVPQDQLTVKSVGLGKPYFDLLRRDGTIRDCIGRLPDPAEARSGVTHLNLLANGSFEQLLQGWSKAEGRRADTEVYSHAKLHKEGDRGACCLGISAKQADHAGVSQTVKVLPLHRYLLSGYIRTQDLKPADPTKPWGPEIFAIEEHLDVKKVAGAEQQMRRYVTKSCGVDQNADDWNAVSVIVETGPAQKEMLIGLTIAPVGNPSSGVSCFDRVMLFDLEEMSDPAKQKPLRVLAASRRTIEESMNARTPLPRVDLRNPFSLDVIK